MNNSKWNIHRVGLIDFWYYDEEEFYFLDGRMLLRGSNGSGKSVTMQSFIPLLLDGNMRPERLDPFGSRARKMENYLLEENDGREERTGYLYMEFKRADADNYMTVGIGMRARKNKKLDSWYFCITDGRRIGKEFPLYKEVQEKIALTKIELRNRIGEGGKVMDTQAEYMQCVNRLIFGFETMEEYKELLDLLIQLRTPKLSKDFKPSVINDILSGSLQTLSEDDLRPMSEAVENMDNIKTNLDTLKESIRAAEQIGRIYDKYNKAVLYNKSCRYLQEIQKGNHLKKEKKELESKLVSLEKLAEEENLRYGQLEQEQETLEEERNTLAQNDVVKLKEEELKISSDLEEKKNRLGKKQKQEEKKKENRLEEELKEKKCREDRDACWSEIEKRLSEMESLMEEIPFEENIFFRKELQEQPEKEASFELHLQALKRYRTKVGEGIKILKQEEDTRQRYDRELLELDERKMERETAEKEYMQCESLFQQEKSELLEQMYTWNRDNRELHLETEQMQELARKLEAYQYGSDYSEILATVRKNKNLLEDALRAEKNQILPDLQRIRQEKENAEKELAFWKNQKDPEPEQTEESLQNRQKLEKLKIPYLQLYKTIDFEKGVDAKKAARIEEALLRMGILDALIIPEEYRRQILELEGGFCGQYIFGDAGSVRQNLMELFQIDNETNDLFLYQKIAGVLSAIGIENNETAQKENGGESQPHTWIGQKGNYRLGILEGTITGNYQPKYIGAVARERYRKEQIQKWEKKLHIIQDSITETEKNVQRLKERLEQAEKEMQLFPTDVNIKVAAKLVADKQGELEEIQKRVAKQEQRLSQEQTKLQTIRGQVQGICSAAGLTPQLSVFRDAADRLEEYGQEIQSVRVYHANYRNGLQMAKTYQMNIESLDEDLDNIRYELGKLETEIRKLEGRKQSISEQLALSDYEQIQERLEHCIRRLRELPREREQSKETSTDLKHSIQSTQQATEENENLIQEQAVLSRHLEKIFLAEYRLGYVEELAGQAEEEAVKLAGKVRLCLEAQVSGKGQEELYGEVQEQFLKNTGYLTEYKLSLQPIFTELREGLEQETGKEADIRITRLDICARYRGVFIKFVPLIHKLKEDKQEKEQVLSDKDRELFEDILANTISKKIRARIRDSKHWVERMNSLMESMQTSSGLRLSLKWKSKRAEKEEQMDTHALVALLWKDSEIMRDDEAEKLSRHFRSKIAEARKLSDDQNSFQSFHAMIREILDYRKWFEFQLECQKTGEKKKELTDRVFFTFSGGEKAMSMYVPLFSAVVAKYSGARKDAPRLISLDEAFAGVDEMNIKDMFRLMVEFDFNFMINSQILWGDYDTVPKIAVYQLVRPENVKFVTVIPYIWNGNTRMLVHKISDETD